MAEMKCYRAALAVTVLSAGFVALATSTVPLWGADDDEDIDAAPAQDADEEKATPANAAYFESLVFFRRRLDSVDSVRAELDHYLRQKVAAIDLVCQLNVSQQRRLRLAGRGDVKRLFDRYSDDRRRMVELDKGNIQEIIREQATKTNAAIFSDPFEESSLFGKILARELTADQRDRYDRFIHRSDRVTGVWLSADSRRKGEIEEVRFPGTDFGDDEMSRLGKIASLERLFLDSTRVTDAGLAHLRSLPNLKELDLGATAITDAGLAHLSGLRSLKRVWLRSTAITDAGLDHLSGLTNLEELDLCGTKIAGAGLKALTDMSTLRSLDLSRTWITDDHLAHLKSLSSLSRLVLASTPVGDEGIAHLEPLDNLRYLDLRGTQLTDRAVPVLLKFPHLGLLDLSDSFVTDRGVIQLRRLPVVRHLYLFNCKVSDSAVAKVKRPDHEVRIFR